MIRRSCPWIAAGFSWVLVLASGVAACRAIDASADANDAVDVGQDVALGEIAGVQADARGDAPTYPNDDALRVNQLQARGSHNSYHVRPDKPQVPADWDYTLAPLDVQLGAQGVRHLELDLHWQADGSFGVRHVLSDSGTTCATLDECLGLVRSWSDEHPGHHLVTLMLEPKDEFDALKIVDHFDDLEAAIVATLGRDKLLVPDDVRGSHASLREALETDGWPTLGATRGRVMLIVNDEGSAREAYLDGDPTLTGKLLFARGGLDEPFGAFLEYGNPVRDQDRIVAGVQAGYLVRTSAVGATEASDEARSQRSAALASGAHWIASDFPAPVDGHDVWLEIPGGTPSRCNPLTAPPWCASTDIEALPAP